MTRGKRLTKSDKRRIDRQDRILFEKEKGMDMLDYFWPIGLRNFPSTLYSVFPRGKLELTKPISTTKRPRPIKR